MDEDELAARFQEHTVPPAARPRIRALRTFTERLAQLVNDLVPEGREKSLAVTHLEEALFWANAGIAREKA